MTSSYFPINATKQEISEVDRSANAVLTSTGIELEYVSEQDWDALSHLFADIVAEQTGAYNVGHWGKDNMEFVVFRKGSKPVGGAAIIVKKAPFIPTGIAILKWGPICQRIGEEFDIELYQSLITQLQQELGVKRNLHLTIMPIAKPDVSAFHEEALLKLGFVKGEGMPAPERYIVNVQDDAETLMKNLDQKWRYNLRKSLKNEFDIRIVDDSAGLDEFNNLYHQMLERKQFMDSSAFDGLEHIMANAPAEIKPIVVLASHEGKITAGGIFHVKGNMASYMFGATDERALRLKAGYAMHWWVAEYLCKNEDISWYDLGGNDLDQGLHQFKKGFVGKSGQIMQSPPRYHYTSSFMAKLVGFAAFQLRDMVGLISRNLHALKKKS